MEKNKKSLPLLILMSCITLMAILCELMPTSFLPQIGSVYGIGISETGRLVGIYALASAIFGIPLISYTVSWNRKKLLTILLIGFSISNLIVGFAPSFNIMLFGRLLGGLCAGTLWPMITGYGIKLVNKDEEGRAVTIIMSGITIGMSVGLPIMTIIGILLSYRAIFLILGIALLVIAFLCYLKLPDIAGEKKDKSNSILTMLTNPGVFLVIVLTFLGVGANYGVYTFITNLIKDTSYPSIATAQLFIGIGSIISVILTMKFIDKHLHLMVLALFSVTAVVFLLFIFNRNLILLHTLFFLWGLEFGSLSSIFQTATAHQVTNGVEVANSLQSSSFNFSIMIGSTITGYLVENSGVRAILLFAVVLSIIGFVISVLNKERFKVN